MVLYVSISECPPLSLVLYTLEQVEVAIDKLDDERVTKKLTVQVDDQDRDAILKKVSCFVVNDLITCVSWWKVQDRNKHKIVIPGRGRKKESC